MAAGSLGLMQPDGNVAELLEKQVNHFIIIIENKNCLK